MNTLKHIIYTSCSCILNKKLITILNNKNYNIKSQDNNCYDNIHYNQYITSQLINREFKNNDKNNDKNKNNDNFDFEIISKNEYENISKLNNIQIIKFM